MEKRYKYLGYFLLLLVPITFAGFFKTYFAQFPNFEEKIGPFIHLHALIASIWILMLIAQPILIFNKKYHLHKKIGRLSYIIFPLLILSFIPHLITKFETGDISAMFFPIGDSILLILFYSLAIYNRKKSSRHMRYMIGTALVFLGPTIGRIGPILLGWSGFLTQHILYGLIYMILITLIFYDKTNNKDYKPYLFIISCFLVHQVIYYLIFL